jgi:hypothetical protein
VGSRRVNKFRFLLFLLPVRFQFSPVPFRFQSRLSSRSNGLIVRLNQSVYLFFGAIHFAEHGLSLCGRRKTGTSPGTAKEPRWTHDVLGRPQPDGGRKYIHDLPMPLNRGRCRYAAPEAGRLRARRLTSQSVNTYGLVVLCIERHVPVTQRHVVVPSSPHDWVRRHHSCLPFSLQGGSDRPLLINELARHP